MDNYYFPNEISEIVMDFRVGDVDCYKNRFNKVMNQLTEIKKRQDRAIKITQQAGGNFFTSPETLYVSFIVEMCN